MLKISLTMKVWFINKTDLNSVKFDKALIAVGSEKFK